MGRVSNARMGVDCASRTTLKEGPEGELARNSGLWVVGQECILDTGVVAPPCGIERVFGVFRTFIQPPAGGWK